MQAVRRGRLALLAALFASALSLRPQVIGVGPLIPEIQDDLAVSHALAGLLGTIPVLCLGLCAPPAPYLSRRLGSRNAIALCLAVVAAFGLVRAFAPPAAAVILLTFGVGIGMGLLGALMPVAVKERFAHRPAFATGIYVLGINVGAGVSAAVAVPIANAAGGWRASLVVFSGFTAALFALWLFLSGGESPHPRPSVPPSRLPVRSGVVWVLVTIFFLLAVIYYGLSAWLPDSYVERGWSEGSAGALISVVNLAALPTTLLVPWLADRRASRRLYLILGFFALAVGIVGIVVLPGAAWGWAAITGLAIGGLFPLVLTLPLDVADRPAEVGAVAGMMLGIGYSLASVSPLALGAIRDRTGSFTPALWVIAGASLLLLVACLPLTRERLRRGVRDRL